MLVHVYYLLDVTSPNFIGHRAAGIPCVVLWGVGKSVTYEVGQQDVSNLHTTWNAVYVDGSWRFVHPYWALKGVSGFNTGTWTKVEEGGQAVRQRWNPKRNQC